MASQPALSSKDTDSAASGLPAAEESSSSHEYVIFPVDNFKTDSIAALLASYPNANVVEHVSVSGWGLMYWDATLSPDQYQEVAANEQVKGLCIKRSGDDCEDPDEECECDPDDE